MRKKLIIEVSPELAEQVVDKSLLPVLGCSDKRRIEWECSHGHRWFATTNNRYTKQQGCPYCSGRLAVTGVNDLATVRPDIASELVDASLGFELLPTSHKKVRWRCKAGHEYEASVSDRVANDSGCPYCSGRKAIPGETTLDVTHPLLAAQLVDKSLGHVLGKGSNRKVEWKCDMCGNTWFATVNSRTDDADMGCPYCAGTKVISGVNDLGTLRPDVAHMLHDKSMASKLSVCSNKDVEWECEKGHVWSAPVSRVTRQGSGCPYCSGKRVLTGFNDLATTRPDLARQLFNFEDGHSVVRTSHRKLSWVCENGHVWSALVSNRTQFGYGCPICASRNTVSLGEHELGKVVRDAYDGEIVFNRRDILGNGQELDIALPDLGIAFEFNGAYWHSEQRRDSMYHYEKSKLAHDAGYRLLHVWEDMWLDNHDATVLQVRSMILGVSFSGNVTVAPVSFDDVSDFCHDRLVDCDASKCDSLFAAYDDSSSLVAVVGCDFDDSDSLHVHFLVTDYENSLVFRSILSYLETRFENVSHVTIDGTFDDGRYWMYRDCGFVDDGPLVVDSVMRLGYANFDCGHIPMVKLLV